MVSRVEKFREWLAQAPNEHFILWFQRYLAPSETGEMVHIPLAELNGELFLNQPLEQIDLAFRDCGERELCELGRVAIERVETTERGHVVDQYLFRETNGAMLCIRQPMPTELAIRSTFTSDEHRLRRMRGPD